MDATKSTNTAHRTLCPCCLGRGAHGEEYDAATCTAWVDRCTACDWGRLPAGVTVDLEEGECRGECVAERREAYE